MRPNQIARLLPAVYQDALMADDEQHSGSVLSALLGVMSVLQESTDGFLSDSRRFIDPWRASFDFVVALAGWVGLDPYLEQSGGPNTEIASLRALTSRAASLARNRGTAGTLIAICELATGVKGFNIEEGLPDESGRPLPYHFRLIVPKAAMARRELIRKIVAIEKPCFVTAEIAFEAGEREGSDVELPDS